MATGGGDSPFSYKRTNWVSSREVHRLSSSGSSQSPVLISPEVVVPPLLEDEHWYKKVSCCHLESTAGDGQGVIVCLGVDAYSQRFAETLGISTYPAFALITCHHVITSRANLKNWRLVISGMEMKKYSERLDGRKFEVCKSCCGPDGVLGQREHPNEVCPFKADFTVLILTKEFATELLKNRDLLIPTVMPLGLRNLKEALQSQRFYLFKRDKSSGIIRSPELDVHKRAPPTEDEQSVEGQVNAYKEMCTLRYGKNPEVLRGDSGAGIFLTEGSERLLLGVHKSTECDEDSHTGIAIHAIFHAIASQERGEECGIIPCLSQLRDGKQYGSRPQFMKDYLRNVQLCLEKREGIAVQVSEEDNDLPLRQVLKIVHFLFKEELLVLSPDSELTVPSINLITAIFQYFHDNFHGHAKIENELNRLYPVKATRDTFNEDVAKVGEAIYKILSRSKQPAELVESCFKCWLSLSYFPHTKQLFTDSTKFGRIGSIRMSKEFEKSLIIHKTFADICRAYQLFIRGELNEAEKKRDDYREEIDRQRDEFEREKEHIQEGVAQMIQEKDQRIAELETQLDGEQKEGLVLETRVQEVEQLAEERKTNMDELQQKCDELEQSLVKAKLALHQHEQGNSEHEREMEELRCENQKLNAENEKLCRNVLLSTPAPPPPPLSRSYSPPHKSASTPIFPTPPSNNYPMRANSLSQTPSCDVDFWQKDFAEVLSKNVQLRQDLGKFFDKTIGSEGKGTWEHLLDLLEKRIPDFKMNPAALETKPVGDIILNIVQEWSKKEVVTVEQFCLVSKHELKIPRVEHILKKAEEKWRYLTFSEQYSVARPGDSTEESV